MVLKIDMVNEPFLLHVPNFWQFKGFLLNWIGVQFSIESI